MGLVNENFRSFSLALFDTLMYFANTKDYFLMDGLHMLCTYLLVRDFAFSLFQAIFL
jgi:hypothetical protein